MQMSRRRRKLQKPKIDMFSASLFYRTRKSIHSFYFNSNQIYLERTIKTTQVEESTVEFKQSLQLSTTRKAREK